MQAKDEVVRSTASSFAFFRFLLLLTLLYSSHGNESQIMAAGRKSASTVSSATNEYDDSVAVDALVADLPESIRPIVSALRTCIAGADRSITQGIKWASASFYCHGWFATINTRAKSGVVVVFHLGAKKREATGLADELVDPKKLLKWLSPDRAVIAIESVADVETNRTAIRKIVKQWVARLQPATPVAKAPSRPKSGGKPTTHDDYLAGVTDEQRPVLQGLRELIHKIVPKAEECISYGICGFRLNGMLVGYGATPKHCAFYLMSGSTIEAHQELLANYDTSKGAIRFQPSRPLPSALVSKLVKARIAEQKAS